MDETQGKGIPNSCAACSDLWSTVLGTKQRLDERRLEVMEMNMLRRMLVVTRRGRLRNKQARERTGVQENIVKEVEKSKMRWYGHVASDEEGREGYGEKSNGLPSDGEKK